MILQKLKSLLFFFFIIALIFYVAHTFAGSSGDDPVVSVSQAGEFITLFDALQDIQFDTAYIQSIDPQQRTLSPTVEVLSPLPEDVGRRHPFSGRIVPLQQSLSFSVPAPAVEEQVVVPEVPVEIPVEVEVDTGEVISPTTPVQQVQTIAL